MLNTYPDPNMGIGHRTLESAKYPEWKEATEEMKKENPSLKGYWAETDKYLGEKLPIEQLMWVLEPARLCKAVTGEPWVPMDVDLGLIQEQKAAEEAAKKEQESSANLDAKKAATGEKRKSLPKKGLMKLKWQSFYL